MDLAGAFLETHRYAAYKGASMELTKFEGVALNVKDKVAYIAMSAIKTTMSDGKGDVQLTTDQSGAVYALALGSGVNAVLGGGDIDSAWVPATMSVPTGLLGEDIAADAFGNTSNIDKISMPDNLKFSENLRTLFIGEDSGRHVNNFVWAYNVDTATLSRIFSAPAGAECTGLQAVDNLNGFAYVMSNFQHPGDWEAIHNTLLTAAGSTLNATINSNWGNKKKAAIGYISGIPCLS
jgi:hypothetical protein